MIHFIELNIEKGKRVLVNTSLIMDIFESADGRCSVVLSADENFPVTQSYEQVKELIAIGCQICR